MKHEDATRARFAATAEQLAAHGTGRIDAMRERLRRFVRPRGDERALDVGAGTGTLALALAPLVAEVVAFDLVPEMLAQLRRVTGGSPNISVVEGDAHDLPFDNGSFDLSATARTLHHVEWPEVVLAEMTRVTRTRGRLLVIDQIASADPLEALAANRIERLRDPSHVRVLPDGDFRALFEMNNLVLRAFEVQREDVELDRFLDLAGCTGDARAAVLAEVERLLAAGQTAGIGLRREKDGYGLTLTVAWYLLEKPAPPAPTTAT
jgi:SAM-dependent methyltransferase